MTGIGGDGRGSVEAALTPFTYIIWTLYVLLYVLGEIL
jgi:hypothetical protein